MDAPKLVTLQLTHEELTALFYLLRAILSGQAAYIEGQNGKHKELLHAIMLQVRGSL